MSSAVARRGAATPFVATVPFEIAFELCLGPPFACARDVSAVVGSAESVTLRGVVGLDNLAIVPDADSAGGAVSCGLSCDLVGLVSSLDELPSAGGTGEDEGELPAERTLVKTGRSEGRLVGSFGLDALRRLPVAGAGVGVGLDFVSLL